MNFCYFLILKIVLCIKLSTLFALTNEEYTSYCDTSRKQPDATDPPLLKTFPEHIVKNAKGCFIHPYNLTLQPEIATTSDNISIKIMHLQNENGSSRTGKPILFLHGLLATSSVWLLNQQPTDLVFQLFQSNYDIWLGNERSNYFSVSKHSASLVGSASYWNYSWHEVGLRDLPAMIDHILNATRMDRIRIVCHSQGCTTFFVMASLMPEYAEKVAIVHALTPAVYLEHSKSPLIAMATGAFKIYKKPFTYPVAINFHQLCLTTEFMFNRCIALYARAFGKSAEALNRTLVPIYLYHYPTISSLREHMHFYQVHSTGKFAPFDEGFFTGQPTNPDEYPLEKIKTRIVLYYCENDLLVDVADVQHLAERLPNVVENNLLSDCNHMDPIIGINVGKQIFENILKWDHLIEQ